MIINTSTLMSVICKSNHQFQSHIYVDLVKVYLMSQITFQMDCGFIYLRLCLYLSKYTLQVLTFLIIHTHYYMPITYHTSGFEMQWTWWSRLIVGNTAKSYRILTFPGDSSWKDLWEICSTIWPTPWILRESDRSKRVTRTDYL